MSVTSGVRPGGTLPAGGPGEAFSGVNDTFTNDPLVMMMIIVLVSLFCLFVCFFVDISVEIERFNSKTGQLEQSSSTTVPRRLPVADLHTRRREPIRARTSDVMVDQ